MDKKKIILIAFIAVAFVGFLDASYLTIEHYRNAILPCVIFTGCEQVTTSVYSKVFGLPVSLYGAGYYLFMLLIAVFYLDSKNELALKALIWLPITGFLVSLYLVYLQLFVIHAICTFCVISAVSSTLLFALGLLFGKINRNLMKEV